jgi:hypothetical protein
MPLSFLQLPNRPGYFLQTGESSRALEPVLAASQVCGDPHRIHAIRLERVARCFDLSLGYAFTEGAISPGGLQGISTLKTIARVLPEILIMGGRFASA